MNFFNKNLYIGLMSGTSMDGIDAALIHAKKNYLIDAITVPYAKTLQEALFEFDASLKYCPQALLTLNQNLGTAFADAVHALLQNTNYTPRDIQAIGSHGQTIYHAPDADTPSTLQLGCPHTIAEKTGITVVADFRTRDLVLGGQGAPLATYYHHKLLKSKDLPAVIVNIGGLSNNSILNHAASPIGYDTGPGNALMDAWIHKQKHLAFDHHGDWASRGRCIPELLDKLLADEFFKKSAPKSIDKSYYSLAWLEPKLDASYQPEDVQATLLHLTALSIAEAIDRDAPAVNAIYLCGGGAHNHALIRALKDYLPDHDIKTTEGFNLPPDYLEAMMLGWLAAQNLQKKPVDLRQITGASKPAILGAIYPA